MQVLRPFQIRSALQFSRVRFRSKTVETLLFPNVLYQNPLAAESKTYGPLCCLNIAPAFRKGSTSGCGMVTCSSCERSPFAVRPGEKREKNKISLLNKQADQLADYSKTPPSTTMVWPVTKLDAWDARYRMASAISCGSLILPIGIFFVNSFLAAFS